jgi:FKBP-type peptidyl-prolyl cis-trans isomerase 2
MAESRSANSGDTVRVHYTGSLDNGEVFDSSNGREPLQFQVGSGEVISGFDDAVRGLQPGEQRQVRIEPESAYGERRDDLVVQVPAEHAPDDLHVGDVVQVGDTRATVVAVDPSGVVIDANHPLAGQALNFDVQVVDVDGGDRQRASRDGQR